MSAVKRAKDIKCQDCMGTGIMGGRQTGIYCPCKYGAARELYDEEVNHLNEMTLQEWIERGELWG